MTREPEGGSGKSNYNNFASAKKKRGSSRVAAVAKEARRRGASEKRVQEAGGASQNAGTRLQVQAICYRSSHGV